MFLNFLTSNGNIKKSASMTSLGHLQPYNNEGNIDSDPEGHLTLSQKIEAFLNTVNAQQNYLNERGKELNVQ